MFDQKNDQKDIKGLITKYLKYWYLFAAGALIALIIAYVYLRYTTPMYKAETSLLFKGDESGGGVSESAAFSDIELLNTSRSIDNEMLVLKSKHLMVQVMKELEMDVAYWIEGQVRDVEIYGDDVPIRIIRNKDVENLYGRSFFINFTDSNSFKLVMGEDAGIYRFGDEIVLPEGSITIVSAPNFAVSKDLKPLMVRFQDPVAIAGGYSNRLGVNPANGKASVVNITITDAIPERASDILLKLVEVYDRENVQDKNQIAEKTVEFIDNRLDYLTQELSRVEMNVEQFKRENELTDVGTQAQQYIASAGTYNKEIEELETQLDVLRSIESYLNAQNSEDYRLVPTTLSIQDATLQALVGQFNQLQLDRDRQLRTGVRDSNPTIVNINEQLRNLRTNILETLKNIKNGLVITRRNLMAQAGMVGEKIDQVPLRDRQLIEITRQQEIKQALYLYLLQKKEEASLSLAAAVSNTRMIDPPIAKGPVSPNKTNIMAYSLILGLFVPFLGVYVVNLFSNKIESRRDIEKLTKTPILGELCHDKSGKIFVTEKNSRTPIAEMFRLIRTNLHFSSGGAENKVILITSSRSGEGKTFFSINICSSLAGAGKRVLLIEMDLRRPKLLKSLEIQKGKGLTDYVVGDVDDISSILVPSGIDPNFTLISAGTLPPNPAEILLNPKIDELLAEMRKNYDYIILDSPPVGKVADALNLTRSIDSSIYIVRYNYTDKEELKIIDDIYSNQKLKKPLIVLNDSKKENNGGYTYGY